MDGHRGNGNQTAFPMRTSNNDRRRLPPKQKIPKCRKQRKKGLYYATGWVREKNKVLSHPPHKEGDIFLNMPSLQLPVLFFLLRKSILRHRWTFSFIL